MRCSATRVPAAILLAAIALPAAAHLATVVADDWKVHDMGRPQPAIVAADPRKAPSDAVVLFDG